MKKIKKIYVPTESKKLTEKRLAYISKKIKKLGLENVSVEIARKSVHLTGSVTSWEDYIRAGKAATGVGFKGVVNNLIVPGLKQDEWNHPIESDLSLDGEEFDVVIVGGGVIGCSILRELSKSNLKIALFEKEFDVAMHASSRNDGMIHPGFAAKPGSKKAHYNVRGNAAYTQLAKELSVPFIRPGSILLYKFNWMKLITPIFKSRAKKNGVSGCQFLSRKEVLQRNPFLKKRCFGGFLMPSAGQLNPYRLVIALAEHAVENGAKLFLEIIVNSIDISDGKDGRVITQVSTNRGVVKTGVVINAAGVWADRIAKMADDQFYSIHYRKGTDIILDIKTGQYIDNLMAMPDLRQRKSTSKGGGLVKTVEGNILVGPTAIEQPMREDFSTQTQELKQLFEHMQLIPRIGKKDIITYFSGIRAATWEEDFIIEKSEEIQNLIHVAGIQSPGLASAPAIAQDVAIFTKEIISVQKEVKENLTYNPYRQSVTPETRLMGTQARDHLIKQDCSYGRIICRCEQISEGEIRDALKSPIPVYCVDGIKRRTRAGAGRCHGGFCTPRILEIISRESGIPVEKLTQKGLGSFLFFGKTKEEGSL